MGLAPTLHAHQHLAWLVAPLVFDRKRTIQLDADNAVEAELSATRDFR